MLQSVPTSQSRPAVASSPASSSSSDQSASGSLLRFAGPLAGSHALVIAANGLDLMCNLLRQGCVAATTLRPSERADHEDYDVVLAPRVTPPAPIGALIYQAKRALRPGGRFVAFVPTSPYGAGGDTVRLLLGSVSMAGFIAVQIRLVRDGVLVRGTLSTRAMPTALPVTLQSCA